MDSFKSSKIVRYKIKNPATEIPSSFCSIWTHEEEKQLLEELKNGMDEDDIAINHQRTVGGIRARVRLIAYKMHINSYPMSEIIEKTKLTEEEIMNAIERRNNKTKKTNQENTNGHGQTVTVKIENTSSELQAKIDALDKKMDIVLSILQNMTMNEY